MMLLWLLGLYRGSCNKRRAEGADASPASSSMLCTAEGSSDAVASANGGSSPCQAYGIVALRGSRVSWLPMTLLFLLGT